tara:strand:- start:4175 stop:4594 length:420 start_codon:yes stop_codon:yes gene_type:complete
MWIQKIIKIESKPRGFHLITNNIKMNVPEINQIKIGNFNLFIQHTSASLIINENTDISVREDLEAHFNVLVPENQNYYKHIFEGPDDIPGHIKSSILGSSISIPITNGELNLGNWQGIYLCEHRNDAPERTLIININGE